MIPVCACKIRRFRNQTPMNTGGRVFPAIPPPLPRRFTACPCFSVLSRVPRSENTTENHTPATIGKPSASRHHRTPRRHRSPRPASGLSAGKPWRPWRTSERPPAPPEASAPCQRFGSSGDRSTAPPERRAGFAAPVSDSGDRAPPPSNAAPPEASGLSAVRPCAAPPVSRKPWRPCAAPPVYPASRPALDRKRRPFDRPPPSPETRHKRPPLLPPQASGK